MSRHEPREPPRGFVELAPAAVTIPATRLVPRDGDVHESLVEVRLRRVGVAPRKLELLVRREELAAADQLQPVVEVHAALDSSNVELYPVRVATILLAGVDLFFRGKLEAALPGHHFVTVDSVELPDLVICDIARIDPDDVVDTYPDCPILGYTNHTDTSGLRRANAAGFDHVVAKSALEERARELVEQLDPSLE